MNEIVALFILLILSGLFSGSETALISISLARVEGLVREGRSGAQALLWLKRNTTQMLIAILIGNNLVNIASASMATVVATRWFGQLGPGIAVGVLTLLILVFGEITPKSLATSYAERISLFIARPLLFFLRAIYPLVWFFEKFTDWVHRRAGANADPMVTEAELISMAEHGAKEGSIDDDEQEMIERIFAFDELTVRDVMTPRDQLFSLESSRKVKDVLSEVLQQPYSRIPLYDRNPDDISKVLYLRDLLEAVAEGNLEAALSEISHDLEFVAQYQRIDELFAKLRHASSHITVVVDEHGVLRGIVTLEDLLEELVGEIYDESDTTPEGIKRLSENEIEVEGTMEVRVIEEFFDLELPGKPTDTVNYWILYHSKRIPEADDSFTINDLKVTVVKASKRRIERILITRPQQQKVRKMESVPSQVD